MKSVIFAVALVVMLVGCYEDPRYVATKNYELASDKLAACIKSNSNCSDLAEAEKNAFRDLIKITNSFK